MTLTTQTLSSMIVVSIAEGKNFPVRNDKVLLVEAKFDGEVMSTDPTTHKTFPIFGTELAWEVDKKSLQMHRLQRTVIKLIFYAADLDLSRKESIGYIVLDTRSAKENEHKGNWMPLLNCKYHKEKPEVLINLFLEKDNMPNGFINQKSGNVYNSGRICTPNEVKYEKRNFSLHSIPRLVQKTPESSLPQPPAILKPVLLPESSFYRIGPPELCQENFIFSVTLAFAANLNKLAPPPAPLRPSKDFFFYYTLFENGVTTGRFASLSNPDFLAERASVKILSSANLLASYFEQNSHLELFLYYGDVPLASGHIPLGSFASVNRHNIDEEPLSIERSVKIYPIEKPCKFGNEDLAPFVGVSVVLQKVKELITPDKPKESPREVLSNGSAVRRANSCSRQSSTSSSHNGNEVNGNSIPHKDSAVSSKPSCHPYRRTHSQEYETSSEKIECTQVKPLGNAFHNFGRTAKDTLFSAPVANCQTISNQRNMNGHVGTDTTDNVSHHFCFSLDLSNFRATRLDHPVNVLFRYSYPFFGSSASILTQPDIEVHPGMDVSIPHGFCAFNFVTTFNMLKATFCECPLILEVLHKKQGSRQEQLIGNARVNLFQVLDAIPRPHMMDGKQASRRMCTCKISVMSYDGRDIGEVTAVLTLDDFGPSTYFCDKNSTDREKTPVISQLRNSVSSFDVPSMKPNGFTHTQDHFIQAAFELEVWKERQRELFRAELQEKEAQRANLLVSEFKKQDAERESLIQRKVLEVQKLEGKLKQTLRDAEMKEKQLASQENELAFRARTLEKEKELREKVMQNKIEAIKTDYEQLLRNERINSVHLREENEFLQKKIRELEAKIHQQNQIITNVSLRSQLPNIDDNSQQGSSDMALKTELNILRMEKTELRTKLQTTTASKEKYKLQYLQLISQLNTLEQKNHTLEQMLEQHKDEEFIKHIQPLVSEKSSEQKGESNFEKMEGGNTCMSTNLVNGTADEESPTSQSASEKIATKNQEMNVVGTSFQHSTTAVKHLMFQKERLLNTGFTENDTIVHKINTEINEAKRASL